MHEIIPKVDIGYIYKSFPNLLTVHYQPIDHFAEESFSNPLVVTATQPTFSSSTASTCSVFCGVKYLTITLLLSDCWCVISARMFLVANIYLNALLLYTK
jgi:hypothetical protein